MKLDMMDMKLMINDYDSYEMDTQMIMRNNMFFFYIDFCLYFVDKIG